MLKAPKAALAAIRPHQWVKNLLVFMPLLAGHAIDAVVWQRGATAFVVFCLTASAVYLINDFLDLEADRAHHSKHRRPLASGALSPAQGVGLLAALTGSALWVSAGLPVSFRGVVGGYLVLNLAYSLGLKKVVMLDVVVLVSFYALRLVAGAEATGIFLSNWLLAFSMFFFFGLAMIKRYTEILRAGPKPTLPNRGYQPGDEAAVLALGSASSLLSILVLTLYLNSPDVKGLYDHPERLWLLAPVLFYWVSHVWLLAHRNRIDDDPVVYAFKEKTSYGCALLAGCVIWFSL